MLSVLFCSSSCKDDWDSNQTDHGEQPGLADGSRIVDAQPQRCLVRQSDRRAVTWWRRRLFESVSLSNITQCVPVPSSEHVAEIVGRQGKAIHGGSTQIIIVRISVKMGRYLPLPCLGCKIKALRAKTNTYIKTPSRGEDPVFVITGRPEDVSAAKREVLAAAEHFTQIRAAKNNSSRQPLPNSSVGSPTDQSDKMTLYVEVPYRVVGLVVGPKGATIKRIQQMTNTHIVTPSKDKEPCFEVSGKPGDVDKAKKEIQSYIAQRTGGGSAGSGQGVLTDSDSDSDFGSIFSPSLDSTSCIPLCRQTSEPKLLSPRSSVSPPVPTSLYGVDSLEGSYPNGIWPAEPATRSPLSSAIFGGTKALGRCNSTTSCSNSITSCGNDYFSYSTPPPLSAPLMSSPVFNTFDFRDVLKHDPPSPTYSCGSNSSDGTAVTSPKPIHKMPHPQRHSTCCICNERRVTAALVPCGHNLFCTQCAQMSMTCPVCYQGVSSVLRVQYWDTPSPLRY